MHEPVRCHPVWARRYISIAQNEILSNGHHSVVLPRDINILYELSRIDEPGLKIAFAEGWITPYIKRKDIKDKRTGKIIKEGAVELSQAVGTAYNKSCVF